MQWAQIFLLFQTWIMSLTTQPLMREDQSEHWLDCHVTSALFDPPFFVEELFRLIRGETQVKASSVRMQKQDRKPSEARKADAKVQILRGSTPYELLVFENKKENVSESLKLGDLIKIQKEMKDIYDRIREDFPDLNQSAKSKLATFGVICSGFNVTILRLDLPFKKVYRVKRIFEAALPRRLSEFSRYGQIIQKVFELQRAVLHVAKILEGYQPTPKSSQKSSSSDSDAEYKAGKYSSPPSSRRDSLAPTQATPKKETSSKKASNRQGKKQRGVEEEKNSAGFHISRFLYSPIGHSAWIAEGYHIERKNQPLIFKVFRDYSKHKQEVILHQLITKLKIPFVLPTFSVFKLETPRLGQYALAMPRMKELPEPNKTLSMSQISKWMRQLLVALNRLHSLGIMHLDIKPLNLLLDSMDNLQLIDFSCSTFWNIAPCHIVVGTKGFQPPEIEFSKTFDPMAHLGSPDIWSAGVTLLCWLLPCLPELTKEQIGIDHNFVEPEDTDHAFSLLRRCLNNKLIIPDYLREALDLVQRMMVWDPYQRWTSSQCLSHPFFSSKKLPKRSKKNYFNKENLKQNN
jgi:serine/threonine protein kinase